VYQGITSVSGYVEFDIEPGLYVIWVWGHNPIGYRPFLSDTWIPIAVLPGETKEVCAALVSLIDIPVLYAAARNRARWEPETFAKLLGEYTDQVLATCNATAAGQRERLLEAVGDLKKGVIERITETEDIPGALLARRQDWARQVVRAAEQNAPQTVQEAKEAARKAVEEVKREPLPTELPCCGELGGHRIDFAALPFPAGPLPPWFIFADVGFTRIWDRIEHQAGALFCFGSVEFPATVWNDAEVMLDFGRLRCVPCKIEADVDGHGPDARLVGHLNDGTTQTAVCPGDKRTLVLSAGAGRYYTHASLSGQEAEWSAVRLF
jgi:hypothetical protein